MPVVILSETSHRHCYQTVPPQGMSHQISRNTAARKIYLHMNIPRVSSAFQIKMLNTNIFFNQKTEIIVYFFFLVILFKMHILRNSQLRKLVSDLKKIKEGEGSE